MTARCSATTSNGYGCINPVQPGRPVCAAHDPSRQCGAPTTTGGSCKRLQMQGHTRCSKHLSQDTAGCRGCEARASTRCRICNRPYCGPCFTDHHHEGYGTPASDS